EPRASRFMPSMLLSPSRDIRLRSPIGNDTLAPGESIGQSMFRSVSEREGGKSGLHRAKGQVTHGRREPTESRTENNRLSASAPVRVKRCGKSAPRGWQQSVAR